MPDQKVHENNTDRFPGKPNKKNVCLANEQTDDTIGSPTMLKAVHTCQRAYFNGVKTTGKHMYLENKNKTAKSDISWTSNLVYAMLRSSSIPISKSIE